jgi:uncharacterized protein with HEPN domain
MRPEDRDRILHMIEAAEAARDFISGRVRADLDSDRMLLFAVVRAIEIIGEAASKISPETRGAGRDVPWNQIVATRNRLIHGYFDIDHGILWKTATDEIPALLSQLRTIIEQL